MSTTNSIVIARQCVVARRRNEVRARATDALLAARRQPTGSTARLVLRAEARHHNSVYRDLTRNTWLRVL